MTCTDARPTLLIPGFAGGNLPFLPFRDGLRLHGIDADAWERAPLLYRHAIAHHAGQLAADVLRFRLRKRAPVTLFGWSEGGLVTVAAMRQLRELGEEDAVRRVITFGSPFLGSWAARAGALLDPILRTHLGEMRPGSPTLAELVDFLHAPRTWAFHALYGRRDRLAPPLRSGLRPEWLVQGPWGHWSPIAHRGLFEVVHRLIQLD